MRPIARLQNWGISTNWIGFFCWSLYCFEGLKILESDRSLPYKERLLFLNIAYPFCDTDCSKGPLFVRLNVWASELKTTHYIKLYYSDQNISITYFLRPISCWYQQHLVSHRIVYMHSTIAFDVDKTSWMNKLYINLSHNFESGNDSGSKYNTWGFSHYSTFSAYDRTLLPYILHRNIDFSFPKKKINIPSLLQALFSLQI